jgi:hypothetical protein
VFSSKPKSPRLPRLMTRAFDVVLVTLIFSVFG